MCGDLLHAAVIHAAVGVLPIGTSVVIIFFVVIIFLIVAVLVGFATKVDGIGFPPGRQLKGAWCGVAA